MMRLRADPFAPPAVPSTSSLVIAAREALAFARQGILLRHDVTAPSVPKDVSPGDAVVVFLHGIFATAGVLRPLREMVGRHTGLHTAAVTYFPGPSIPSIASCLDRVLGSLPKTAQVHLVGHSLGGVVARWFALESNDPRIVETISLGSPFAGIARAAWLGMPTMRDLSPDSAVLRRIRLHPRSSEISHLSIIAGADALLDAPMSHALAGGDVRVMEARGHNTLLFDEEVALTVEERVLATRAKLLAVRVQAAKSAQNVNAASK